MLPQSLRRNPSGRATIGQVSLPAPVGGINASHALLGMPQTDATVMTNYFPSPSFVELRPGYSRHVGALPSTVETLAEYASGASSRLFAAAGTTIHDVTDATASATTAAVTSLTNARWQHTMFSAGAGDYLVMVNGADGVRTYNGTGWSNQSAAISSVTASNLINVATWKRRLWFVKQNDTRAYYLGADAIAGSMTNFQLGAVWRYGGALRAITSISTDSGDGIDDLIAFISTEGEVAIYQGTDPDSASTFSLIGVYRIGRPVGDRCIYRFAGDAIVLTENGAVSLLSAMNLDPSQEGDTSLSRKIKEPLSTDAATYGGNYGWQAFLYPARGMAVVNVPESTGMSHQWIMNVMTGAWCRFENLNALCWGLLNQRPYFASGSTVYEFDEGSYADNGATIFAETRWAFSTLRTPRQKRFTAARALIRAGGNPALRIGLDIDYSDNSVTSTVPTSIDTALWDVALWDEAEWPGIGATDLIKTWVMTRGIGVAVAPRVATETKGIQIQINAFDMMYETSAGPTF